MCFGLFLGLIWVSGVIGDLNILHITDVSNEVADMMFNESLKTIPGKYILRRVSGNNENYIKFQTEVCSTFSKMLKDGIPPHLVYDTTLTGLLCDSGSKFTASLGLPTFTTSYGGEGDLLGWDLLRAEQKKYLIQVNPPNDLIPEIVRSVVSEQGYATAAVLVDESYEISHKYKSLLQNIAVRHTISFINKTHTIQQLLSLRKNELYNIFIIGSLKNIRMVLSSADAISQFTEKYSWHAITHERGTLQCPCKKATIFFAQSKNYQAAAASKASTAYLFAKFYDDLFGYMINATLKAYQETSHANYSYITCEEFNGTNTPSRNGMNLREAFLIETAGKSFTLLDQETFIMDFDLDLSFIDFREGSLLRTQAVGTWRANFDSKLNLTNPKLFYKYASKTVYRVITRVYHPFIYRNDDAPRGYTGYCIDLLDEIAALLGFDYQILEVVDGEMGRTDEDGNWNGMIQELVAKRADIALGAMSVTAQREQVVDFTVPYYEMIGHAILVKVHQTPTSLFRFLQVFDSDVWYTIMILYSITSVFIWSLFKLSPFGAKYVIRKRSSGSNRRIRYFNFWECLWFCLISITPSGGGEAPVNSSARMMVAFWWFFCYIMYSSYSANLAAFLTVSRFDTPITSLDDLVTQYDIRYSTVNDSGSQEYFQRMASIEKKLLDKWQHMNIYGDEYSNYERSNFAVWEYPLSDKFTKIWNNMDTVGFPNTIDDAVELVRSSPSPGKGYAMILDAIDAQYLAMTNCDLDSVDEFFKRPLAIAVQKGSYLKDRLSSIILELSNKRVLTKLKEKWWAKNPNRQECVDQAITDSVDISNMGGVFIYLGCALSGVATVTGIEFLYKIHRRNKINNFLEL